MTDPVFQFFHLAEQVTLYTRGHTHCSFGALVRTLLYMLFSLLH